MQTALVILVAVVALVVAIRASIGTIDAEPRFVRWLRNAPDTSARHSTSATDAAQRGFDVPSQAPGGDLGGGSIGS